MWKNLVSNLVY